MFSAHFALSANELLIIIRTQEQAILTLDILPIGTRATIHSIDWSTLGEAEGRRLRELGLIEGADVEPLYRGSLFSKDPLAVRVGRMDVIVRLAHAAKISVSAGVQ